MYFRHCPEIVRENKTQNRDREQNKKSLNLEVRTKEMSNSTLSGIAFYISVDVVLLSKNMCDKN